jgi:peptidoglycan L-alanyl-D-glutamate endopeptidase CwlK
MTYALGQRSKGRLIGIHPDLRKVIDLAIAKTSQDFTIIQGLRTVEEQRKNVQAGKSQTMRSRHLTGHAVDLGAWVDGALSWDGKHYAAIAKAMKAASTELGIPITWGGDWKTLKDLVHFELTWKDYP